MDQYNPTSSNRTLAPHLLWSCICTLQAWSPVWALSRSHTQTSNHFRTLKKHLSKGMQHPTEWNEALDMILHQHTNLHGWQQVSPPPPVCPLHSSCPLWASVEPGLSVAAGVSRASSLLHPLSRPHLRVLPPHHHQGPSASGFPVEHHLWIIQG